MNSSHDKKIDLFDRYSFRIVFRAAAVSSCDLSDKQWKNVQSKFALGAERDTVIGFIDTSLASTGKKGYLFTDEKVYYLGARGKPKKLWYDEIRRISLMGKDQCKDSELILLIRMKDGSRVQWTNTTLNKTPLCEFFNELLNLESSSIAGGKEEIRYSETKAFGAESAGFGVGNYNNVNKIYGEEKFHARQGHGFAAERANHLADRMKGLDAKIVGDNNIKNGADRILDGVYIQSKYCATGARCINDCFDGNGSGTFRYMRNGKPMQIEVPSDMYDAAIRTMEQKIEKGQVSGITNKSEAKNIVRKGHFTYSQAKNIAKAGTVDSLTYDAVNGAVIASSAFGVTAIITFAFSIWSGDSFNVSLKTATYSGLKVGGVAFISSILASQLSKAGLNSVLVGSSEAIVRCMGPKASAVLINAFRTGAKPIYGAAAMKSAAKLLRGNVITAGATVVAFTSFDIANIFRGRISGKQLLINLLNTSSTVIGGSFGWIGGAALGSTIMPGVGTVVGGIVGSFVAGGTASKATDIITGKFCENDADKMVIILQEAFEIVANEYLLNHNEAEKCVDRLGEKLNGKVLKNMFASKDRVIFAKKLIIPIVRKQVAQREKVTIPSNIKIIDSLKTILEEIADTECG